MSAWTQFVRTGPALLILVLVLAPQIGYAAPFENTDQSTEIEYYPVADATGCYYNFEHYDEGDRIITNEPCLNCTCHNRMLMCYLRVCPFTKAIGQNCKMEKKADQCCPVITCPEVPVQLVPHASTTPSTQVGHLNDYGCSIDNLFYADGAKVPSNPDNPCEVCYCIRNKTACIIQECTLTGDVVEGCRPVYVDGVCCPVRYDCEHPQLETTTRPLLTTTTTTLPPTSSPADCIYNNEVYADGALVKKDVPCEQCYCMRGDIICAVQECGPTPLDKVNCTALLPKEGQCCPDTYECENISEEDLTTLSYYEAPTTKPTIVSSDEGTTESREDETPVTRVSIPHESPSEVTKEQIAQTTVPTESQTRPEESSATETATVEPFTSKMTEAVESVTSKITEIVEAITSKIIGSEQEVTTQPETVTEEIKQEPEVSTLPEQSPITEKGIEITQTEESEPSEGHPTDTELHVTEGYTQETKVPVSDDQKLVTIPEYKQTVTTESSEKETEGPEAGHIDQEIHHDDHGEPGEEESEGYEHDLTEGSGEPLAEPEPHITKSPEEESEDRHTRPIDQTQTEQSQTTSQLEIETTSPLPEKVPQENENELIESSGTSEVPTATTSSPELVTIEAEKLPQTTQPTISKTDESDIATSGIIPEESTTIGLKESSDTETPGKPVSEEPIIPQHCDEYGCGPVPPVTESVATGAIQPVEAEKSTEQTGTETPALPAIETTISVEELPHADFTKEPDDLITQEVATKPSTEEQTIEPLNEISTTPLDTSHKEEEPSITEATLVTDAQKEKGESPTTEEPEEEVEIVTEIPTKDTEKPQSMDHVQEPFVPATTPTPESEIPSGQKATEEGVTPIEKEGFTELPKEGQQPQEKITELPQFGGEAATVPSVVCSDESGCATGQEDTDKKPTVVEECTKESCTPQSEIPQSEGNTEANIVPQGPVACGSEQDCLPGSEKEVVTEPIQVPIEPIPVVTEGTLPALPTCDTDQGCAPGKETEGAPQSCDNELDCIPDVPGKEAEIPSLDACLPDSDCGAGKEVSVTDGKGIQPGISVTEPISVPEQTTVGTAFTEKEPEEESSGEQPATETLEVVTELTEGSGEVGEDHAVTEQEEVPEGTKAPKLSPDEKLDQETEQTVLPERSTEAIPERQPEKDYDRTEIPQQTLSEGTESPLSPDVSKTPEEVPTERPDVPNVTELPVDTTPTPELENEVTHEGSEAPLQTSVPQEVTASPELVETEVTEAPKIEQAKSTAYPVQGEIETSTAPKEIQPGTTDSTEDTGTGETQAPDQFIPAVTLGPESVSAETTLVSKEGITETEAPQIIDRTEIPDQISIETTQKPEEDLFAEKTTLEQAIPESTPSAMKDVYSSVLPEIVNEDKGAPEEVTTEEVQLPTLPGSSEISSEATFAPEQPEVTESSGEPKGTRTPEPEVSFGETVITQEPLGSTQAPKIDLTDHTQPPEQSEGTEGPTPTPTESIKDSEQPIPDYTSSPEEPRQPALDITTLPTEIGSGEIEPLETTPVPEYATEKIYVPEESSKPTKPSTVEPEHSAITEIPEQVLPETSRIPGETQSEVTQTPSINETPATAEGTELPEVTSPEQRVTEVATEAVKETEEAHGIPGEGSCLVDGQTYKNNSNVPPFNQCQTSCKCVSSILQCESVPCTPPPSNLQDCMPIFHSLDSCCPTYSCSVPGVTSMESDSHVVETTTVALEEEKAVTVGAQVVTSEQTTVVPAIYEGETTSKEGGEPFVTVRAEPGTEQVTSKGVETPVTEKEPTEITSEEATTEKTALSEKPPEPEVGTEETITEIGKDIVPESQTIVQDQGTTVSPSQIIITEESIKLSEEQTPASDDTENEVSEESIVPEQCGVSGCAPQIPVTDPVVDTVTEVEHIDKSTEQPLKEVEVPGTEVTATTEQPITSEPELAEPVTGEPTQGKVSEVPVPVTSDLSRKDEPTTTEAVSIKEHITETVTEDVIREKPAETEQTPSKSETPGEEEETEASTEIITEVPSYTETPHLPATEETSKSPEEIAAIPEIEEAATSPSILPEAITESAVTEIEEEFTGPEGEKSIPTTESHISTEQPIIQDEGESQNATSIPEVTETEKPQTKPEIKPHEEVTETASYPTVEKESIERQTEIPSSGKVTLLPENVKETEPEQGPETTTPGLMEVTESEQATIRPESAAHITEPAEIEKSNEIPTPVPEITPETVTKHDIKPEESLSGTEAPIVPQTESKIEETEAGFTTETYKHETSEPELESSQPAQAEITTVSAEQEKITEAPIETIEKETEKVDAIPSITETPKPEEGAVTEEQKTVTEVEQQPVHVSTDKETETKYTTVATETEVKEGVTSVSSVTEAEQPEGTTEIPATKPTLEVSKPHIEPSEVYASPEVTTLTPANVSELYTSGPHQEPSTKKYVEGELSTSIPLTSVTSTESTTFVPTFAPAPVPGHDVPGEHVPELPDYHPAEDYDYEDQGPLGPGTCRYGGKVYVSAQQIPRDDPCDFCFCFRSDIICLQQSCPPPIPRCHEEPIRGFCCPRYECPVGMAAAINVTTSTTTTTTTLPPHFLSHAYKGRVKRAGCQIKGKAYRVGEDIESASGPCLHCTCGGDGEMKCDPKVCSPEPMLRQMIAAATSRRRR